LHQIGIYVETEVLALMGSLLQVDVLPSSTTHEPDSAHEIGAVSKQQAITACRIGMGTDNELAFLDEVEIKVSWDVKEELLSDGTNWRWWRYEAKVDPRREGSAVKPGQSLVIAEHPYAISRTHQSFFKVGSHKGREDRSSLAKRFASGEELMKNVEALRIDYWERGNWLTAGLSNPEMSFRPDGQGRRFDKDALYVLGICENFENSVENLITTSHARKLVRITRNRSIRFWHHNVTTPPRLYEEVAEQAESLLLISIRQALAGPHMNSESWKHKPVMDLVDHIYRDHLNACNRRVRARNEIGENSGSELY
jgi:hypothetical protein